MRLTSDYWLKYINIHTSANKTAARLMERYIQVNGTSDMNRLSDYAYALVSKYGEAASALSCEMYDQLARTQRANVPDAVPAETASYGEVAKAVRGAGKRSPSLIPDAVGRLVKQAGADTTLQNAKRDGAYFAWVAHGDTCPYCMALAGLGWQKAGKETLRGSHAEHIHANCDCEYVIDFKGNLSIDGYDPEKINQELLDMTDGEFDAASIIRMSGHNSKGRNNAALNAIRRKQYAANKDYINAQKREAYSRRTTSFRSVQTGGKSYAPYNPEDPRDVAAANEYRKISRRNDIEKVAQSSEMTKEEIKEIRRHIFFDKHKLHEGYGTLHPDYDMAVAWKRLSEGRPEERDIILMKHELLESRLEKEYNLTIAEAHKRAKKKYDWEKALEEAVGANGEPDGLL